jgi:hypothetical protein
MKLLKLFFCLALILPHRTSAMSLTPLIPLPAPRIVHSSTAYSEDYAVTNLFGQNKKEYASASAGTNTEIEFDFGGPVAIAAFRHVDRNDPATVALSELEFFDRDGKPVATVPVKHVNQRNGDTFLVLPAPITAQRVKWRVTKLGNSFLSTVGGAKITFYTTDVSEPTPQRDRVSADFFPFIKKDGTQPVRLTVNHAYVEPVDVKLELAGLRPQIWHLKSGPNVFYLGLPAVSSATNRPVQLEFQGQLVVKTELMQKPVRPLTVYVLPMSHTDIGYALSQSASADRQVTNLLDGMAAARRTANYPPGARFVWNVEVLWAADLYWHRMNEQQRADFVAAVKQGQVELNGMYANELTGLCRPEELIQLFRPATKMAEATGVPIQSAMISDVPGYTRGTVTAMAQAGIKYFSAAPNYFDRIGTIFRDGENRPFYWVAADGRTKVLTWIPFKGYALSHIYQYMSPKWVSDLSDALDGVHYPYDITYVRWAGHSDNAKPDPAICDFIKDWNAKYTWPHFIISGTTEAFQAFESRYGSQLPRRQGDWTPYWEDGAGSSAAETALNRNSAERLTQADALWALLDPAGYPTSDFSAAWQNVLLYSEHTWGADVSVRQPRSGKTSSQWAVKQAFADDADQQAHQLVVSALAATQPASPMAAHAGGTHPNLVDVINTLSWPRSGLVKISPELSSAGDRVTDERGHPVISQRLNSNELVFWAGDVPPFAAKRFVISPGAAYKGKSSATVQGAGLDNGMVRVRIDQKSGAIAELTSRGTEGNLVNSTGGQELNDYLYLPGANLKDLQPNGPVKIVPDEKGPLVASLVVESDAPGCNQLSREIQVVAGQDYVELVDLVDKARLEADSYLDTKESVNFAFPFNIPQGRMLLDIPLGGAMCPQTDQLPGSCKNWFTVGRWVDISNAREGVTWVTLDAPLIEVGSITANLLNSQTDPEVWRQKVDPTQTFYSWVMNNHWSSNYRAYQEGTVIFRYILRPHGGGQAANPGAATRFATAFSEPLIPVAAIAGKSLAAPLLTLSSDDVIVMDLKPSDDRKAWIVRLYGATGKDRTIKLHWHNPAPKAVYLSDTSEREGAKIDKTVAVPGYGLVTLRVEREP